MVFLQVLSPIVVIIATGAALVHSLAIRGKFGMLNSFYVLSNLFCHLAFICSPI